MARLRQSPAPSVGAQRSSEPNSGGITISRSRHAQQFVTIPNATARDGKVSFRARGLLAHLLSLPDGWRVTTTDLAEDNPEGRDAIRAALAELERAGYVTAMNVRGERGRLRLCVEVHDTPQPERTHLLGKGSRPRKALSPVPGKPVSGLTCDDALFPQVAPETEKPETGGPVFGESGTYLKTEPKDGSKKTGEKLGSASPSPGPAQTAAQRQAAAPDDDTKVRITWQAQLEVYGEYTSKEEALRLWARFIDGRRTATPLRDPGRYLAKIFADAPNVDSLLANTGDADDYQSGPSHRHDVFCPPSCDFHQHSELCQPDCWGACPRCSTSFGAYFRPLGSGLCYDCDREVFIDGTWAKAS